MIAFIIDDPLPDQCMHVHKAIQISLPYFFLTIIEHILPHMTINLSSAVTVY